MVVLLISLIILAATGDSKAKESEYVDSSKLQAIFLNTAGHECQSAETGEQTLAMAFRHNPDVILLDLRLGDMSGFQVMKFLSHNALTSSIPILILTGEPAAEDLLRDAASNFNAKAYIRKPVDLVELLSAIKSAAGSRKTDVPGQPWMIQRGAVRIDLRRREVLVGGAPLKLGPKRFEILCALARSRDGLSGRMLRALVWGGDAESLNTVVKTITRLRRDLLRASGQDLVVPVAGGYKLQ